MTLGFTPQAGSPTNLTENVTPSSAGCGPVSGYTKCTFTIGLAPGTYTIAITTFDQQNGTGNALSTAQNVSKTIQLGKSNVLSFVLGGIPHTIGVTSTAAAVHGSQAGGFTIYGTAAQSFTIGVTDADGRTIVGPGSPAIGVSLLNGTGWTLATPAPNSPGVFGVTPSGTNGSSASFQVTASYSDPSVCTESDASCTASFSMANDIQKLYVLNMVKGNGVNQAGTVAVYTLPVSGSSVPSGRINDTNGANAQSEAYASANGYVFISHCLATCGVGGNPPDSVSVFNPPFFNSTALSTPYKTLTTGVSGSILPLAVDSSGDVFVGNDNGSVSEYAAPSYANSPTVTISISGSATALAVDSNNNLWIGNCNQSCGGNSSDSILEYAPPYNGSPAISISAGVAGAGKIGPSGFAFGTSGTLLVSNEPSNTGPPWGIEAFSPPVNAGGATATMSLTGIPFGMVTNAAGDVFVNNCGAGCTVNGVQDAVLEFTPPYSGSATTILSGPSSLDRPDSIGLDGFGNLLVANQYNANVLTVAPPYNAGVSATVTGAGVVDPLQLVLSP